MTKKHQLTVLITSVILALMMCRFAFAADEDIISPQKIYPGSFYYSLKRAEEKIQAIFLFSKQDKFNYYQTLVKNRLSELKYVADKKLLGEFQQSSERFSYQAGILSSYVSKSPKSQKDQTVNLFNSSKNILEKLRDEYPANSSYWLFVQQNIDTLDLLAKQLQ